MAIRGSESYIYYLDNLLGSGSSGKVYFGRHKRKGDACAVKFFSKDHLKIQKNEIQLMQRLNHENIVKLLAIEKDSRDNNELLIMEYCSEGSLQNYLKKPENLYGFKDSEMIDFCRQFSSGLKYLWMHGITHRDIKPGNILCLKKEDNKIVFKITDFGSSQEYLIAINPNGLYGTLEYLHPKVFYHIMNDTRNISDSDNTIAEIWAVGVTIYQVATGKLPFNVHNGRSNKKQMYKLISSKKSGDISGFVDNEKLCYSAQLPTSCLLSKSVQDVLVNLLRRCLETNEGNQLNYETFFPEMEKLTDTQFFYLFLPLSYKRDVILWPNKEDTKFELEDRFSKCMYFHSDYLVDTDDCYTLFRWSSIASPIILIENKEAEIGFKELFDNHFNLPKYPKFSRDQTLITDSEWAQLCCAFMHRIFDVFHRLNEIKSDYETTETILKLRFLDTIQRITFDIDGLALQFKVVSKVFSLLTDMSADDKTAAKDLRRSSRIEAIRNDILSLEKSLPKFNEKDLKQLPETEGSYPQHDKRILEMETNLKYAGEINEHFLKDKHRSLNYNDDQIHKLHRSKLASITKTSHEMLVKDIWPEVGKKIETFLYNYRKFFIPTTQALKSISDEIEWCKDSINAIASKIININCDEEEWNQIKSSKHKDDFSRLNGIIDIQEKLLAEIKLIFRENQNNISLIKPFLS